MRPYKELGKDGLGAFEVALRNDQLDLGSTPILARAGNEATSVTPLDPVGATTSGDALATRLHFDF